MSQENAVRLPGKQEEAAALVAEDRLSDHEIAERLSINRRTLTRWRTKDEAFKSRVAGLRAEMAAVIMSEGIARKEVRVRELSELNDQMKAIQRSRADDNYTRVQPGGATGLIKLEVIPGGRGSNAVFDQQLVRERRAVLEQVAKELGQLTEKQDLTSNGEPIAFTFHIDRRDDDI